MKISKQKFSRYLKKSVVEGQLFLILVTALFSIFLGMLIPRILEIKNHWFFLVTIIFGMIFVLVENLYFFFRSENKLYYGLMKELQNSFNNWEPTIDIENISVLSRLPDFPIIYCKFMVIYRKIFSSAEKIEIWPVVKMNPPIFANKTKKEKGEEIYDSFWRTKGKKILVGAGRKQNGETEISLMNLELTEYVKYHKELRFPDKKELTKGSQQEISLSLQLFLQWRTGKMSPAYKLEIHPVYLNFPSKIAVFNRIVDSKCLKRIQPWNPLFQIHGGDRYSAKYTNLCFLTEKFIDWLGKEEKKRIFQLEWIKQDIARLICDEIQRDSQLASCRITKFGNNTDKENREEGLDIMNSSSLISELVDKIGLKHSGSETGKQELYIGIFQTKHEENIIRKRNARGVFLFGISDENTTCVFDLSNRELFKTCNLEQIKNIEEDKENIDKILDNKRKLEEKNSKKMGNARPKTSKEEEIDKKICLIEDIAGKVKKDPYYALHQFILGFSEFIVSYGGFVNSVPEFTEKWVDINTFEYIIQRHRKGEWFKSMMNEVVLGYLTCHAKEKNCDEKKSQCGENSFIILNLCSEDTDTSDRALKTLYDWKLEENSFDVFEFSHSTTSGWNTKRQLPQDNKAVIVTAFDSHVKELRELITLIRRHPYKIKPYVLIPIFSLADFRSEINRNCRPGDDIDIDVFPIFYLRNNVLLVSKRIFEIKHSEIHKGQKDF